MTELAFHNAFNIELIRRELKVDDVPFHTLQLKVETKDGEQIIVTLFSEHQLEVSK